MGRLPPFEVAKAWRRKEAQFKKPKTYPRSRPADAGEIAKSTNTDAHQKGPKPLNHGLAGYHSEHIRHTHSPWS
eukprot:7580422-Karenia_brevis.AAC.1